MIYKEQDKNECKRHRIFGKGTGIGPAGRKPAADAVKANLDQKVMWSSTRALVHLWLPKMALPWQKRSS